MAQADFSQFLEEWIEAGLGGRFDAALTKATRDEENAAFFATYRAQRARGYSAEEIAEMRAAFGPGETVVNIITGERIRL